MPITQPIKWHGGKNYLAPWIISHMSPHTRYCEPFFGGGAVLFRKPCEGVAEFVNDINLELTNLWRVLSIPSAFALFERRIQAIPFSEVLFDVAKLATTSDYKGEGTPEENSVDAAVCFFIRYRQSRQGLGKDFATPTTRLRRGMNEQVSAWLSAVDGLPEAHARLRRVEIRCMTACKFIQELDTSDTLFYCDPPYLHGTRFSNGEYEHEMTDAQHCDLLRCLSKIKGRFILSGYPNGIYAGEAKAHGWRVVTKQIDNKASSKREKEIKIECLWMNY